MKLLLISDVHGNLEALNAITERESYDKMLFVGDIVDYGPRPKECLDFIKDNAFRVVRGNHDHAAAFRVDCNCSYRYKHLSAATREYTRKVLSTDRLKYLQEMPLSAEFDLEGYSFYMVHASPRDNLFRYLAPETPKEVIEKEVRSINADFILLGHTHMPSIWKVGEKTVINPGSVGQPRDRLPKTAYAVMNTGNGRVVIKREGYDLDKTIENLKKTGLEKQIIEELSSILKRGY